MIAAPGMSNLNALPGQPRSRVSEDELLRTIAAAADCDSDFSGLGDFSADQQYCARCDMQPAASACLCAPMAAEACTELGADTPPQPPQLPQPHGLAWLFDAYPRAAGLALLCFVLLCMGFADTSDIEALHEQALAEARQAAASEVQP